MFLKIMNIASLYLKGQGKPCECGCGAITTLKRGSPQRYIRGHNASVTRLADLVKKHGSPMKGKRHSIETKIKISTSKTKIKIDNFNGFKNTSTRSQRNLFRKIIQKQVFERDNYTCQICAKRGCFLQVDHIQPWAEYVELRFNIDNCRTLCQHCHYKITYGREMPKHIKTWGQNFKFTERMVD